MRTDVGMHHILESLSTRPIRLSVGSLGKSGLHLGLQRIRLSGLVMALCRRYFKFIFPKMFRIELPKPLHFIVSMLCEIAYSHGLVDKCRLLSTFHIAIPKS